MTITYPYNSYNAGVTYGTHFSDGVRVGSYFDSEAGNGAHMSPIYVYNIVPATISTTSLVTAGSYSAGYLTIAGLAGTATITTILGVRAAAFDVPRNVTVTSSGNEAGNVFTIYGYDYLGKPMVETISGVNANTVAGKKAFAFVTYIYNGLGAIGNISVGNGDVFGLPYALSSLNYVTASYWNSASGGTPLAAIATTATATTGDVRGTVAPPTASDGVKRLTVTAYVAGAVGSTQSFTTLYGVAQYTQALI